MRKVVRRPIALSDALEQATYIARDNPEVAHRFLHALQATCHRLAEFPFSGKQYVSLSGATPDIRYIRVSGFPHHMVFYRVTESELEIIRVLLSARNFDAIALTDD